MSKCVQCGYCCRKAPCAYGTWNEQEGRCDFLTVEKEFPDGTKIYKCARYHEIQSDPTSQYSPAFGAGCSSNLFNDYRDAVLKNLS